jgi:Uncharacterised nucleotidyltransferase
MSTTLSPTDEPTVSAFVGAPWEGVARVLERAADLGGLRLHRLHLLAVERLRELGRPIPEELAVAERSAVRGVLLARALLARVRDVCDGPIMVIKGPEVAAVYPSPWLRPYVDIDVLVPNARDAERRLRAAGFEGVGPEMDWDSLHHVQRLAAPGLLAVVEVHRRPKWLTERQAPTVDQLLAESVPSATGVDGLLAPSHAYHAVLLAAHAWAHCPLGCVGDLVDVAAMRGKAPERADELAHLHELDRVWRSTLGVIEALLVDDRCTWAMRTWARHLGRARDRTVAETHLARLLEPFASLPPRRVPGALAHALGQTLLPHRGEGWPEKLDRTRRALGSPRMPISHHLRSLEDEEGDR